MALEHNGRRSRRRNRKKADRGRRRDPGVAGLHLGANQCRPFGVAEMVLCAAVLIRMNTVGDVVPSLS
jgi:hypothetical protein